MWQNKGELSKISSETLLDAAGTYIDHADGILEVRNDELYRKRFQPFAEFYRQVKGEEYPLDEAEIPRGQSVTISLT